jgi:WD40 repeat protein/serine/threonine protein kinase
MPTLRTLEELVDEWETHFLDGKETPPDMLCRDRPELLEALQPLIAARRAKIEAQRQRNTTVTSPTAAPGSAAPPPVAPTLLGFDMLERLGVGAVGEVWKAWQPALKRFVAIKFMRRDALLDQSAVQRFRQEAKAIAQLHRSDIVQIFDVGIPDDGQPPYLVLEYVDGGTLAKKMSGVAWEPREAAAFIEEIARAMHVVHRQGIVHRDLKPANILLASQARLSGQIAEDAASATCARLGNLTPKITDFGLAKRYDRLTGAATSHTEERTQTGVILGTPNYMAPEQARGETGNIGPPADVHALGAILYELLTGRPPYRAANHLDTLLMVIHTEPVPVRVLRPEVPRDLESICLMCLRKIPEARYTSAGALAEDLRRFQVGEPVQANPVSRLEMALRWSRRRLLPASFLLAVLVVLLLVCTIWTLWATKAYEDARLSLAAAEEAQKQRDLALKQKVEAEHQAAALQARLSAVQLARVALLWDRNPWLAHALLHDQRTFPLQDRDMAWHFYNNLSKRAAAAALFTPWAGPGDAQRQSLWGHAHPVLALALSKSGKTLVSGDAGGTIKVWNLASGLETATLRQQKGPVTSLVFCGHARTLATCGGGPAVQLCQEQSGEGLGALGPWRRGPVALAIAANGPLLAVGYRNGAITLWDASTHQQTKVFALHIGPVTALAISADGKTLASTGMDGKIALWDDDALADTHRVLKSSGVPLALAFSPDGKILASAGKDRMIQLWHLGDNKDPTVLQGHAKEILALAFSADGKTLASGSADGTIRLWDVNTGQERAVIKGHGAAVSVVLFSADGRTLISAGHDGTIKLWDVGSR